MEDPIRPISAQSRFQFACSPDLACFNACCRNLNQFLTPYDILRLKNHLGCASSEFLEKYTTRHVGPETGLPVVTLKPEETGERLCPFVSPTGCRVYPDRPSSCRIYPLARAVSRCRNTGRITEHFALIREPHCLGFRENKFQTVSEWLRNQKLSPYNALNDLFLEIITLKRRSGPGPLDFRASHIFQLALYDIDRFKDHIFNKGLLDDMALAPRLLKQLKEDEIALLKFAHRWVKEVVFNEQTRKPE
jgi:Fe-S-cluster containining protein